MSHIDLHRSNIYCPKPKAISVYSHLICRILTWAMASAVISDETGVGDGGGGDSTSNGEQRDNLDMVFDTLKKDATNGLALNGLLVWIDVQQRSMTARSCLLMAAEKNKNLIGNVKQRTIHCSK